MAVYAQKESQLRQVLHQPNDKILDFRLCLWAIYLPVDRLQLRISKLSEQQWTERFASGRRSAHQAQADRNTPAVLGAPFNRIYTLRNQVIHGDATWNSSVNRDHLRACSNLLGKLVPVIILLMPDKTDTL